MMIIIIIIIITSDGAIVAACVAENVSNSMHGCGAILAFFSWVLVALTFPLSLCICIKVTAKYTLYNIQYIFVTLDFFVWSR